MLCTDPMDMPPVTGSPNLALSTSVRKPGAPYGNSRCADDDQDLLSATENPPLERKTHPKWYRCRDGISMCRVRREMPFVRQPKRTSDHADCFLARRMSEA